MTEEERVTNEAVALCFVEAINSHQPEELFELMTETHVFIDSDGSEYPGRERMLSGWRDYFEMVPDFLIKVNETFSGGESVVFLGIAEGTFSQNGVLDPENHWVVPAAWKAVIEDERVAVWQVFVNPESMREIQKRMGAT